nr:ATP-binding protein [Geotalea sp. SG265]
MVLSGLPLVLAVVLLLYGKYRADYSNAQYRALVTSRAIAYRHSAQVEGFRNLLNALSQHPAVRVRDKEACSRILREILRNSPSSSNIGIADLQGNLIASGATPLTRRFGIGDRKYFRDAVRTGRFSAGEFTISRALGKPALHFALPVFDGAGVPQAVIYAAHDLGQFNVFFNQQGFPYASNLTITDYRGIVLHTYPAVRGLKAGSPDRQVIARRMESVADEGTFVERGLDGVNKLFAFKKVRLQQDEEPYMYIRVAIPLDVVMAPVNQSIITSLAVVLLAAGLTFFLSRRLAGRYLTNPLERLSSAAREVAGGNLSVRTALPCNDELGELSRSFDAMTASLGERLREKNAAEAQLKAIFDYLNDAIFIQEVGSGRITQVNRAMCEMFGWTAAEAAGLTVGEISQGDPPYSIDEARQYMKLAERGEPQLFEWWARRRDGSVFWTEVSMRRARIGSGDALIVLVRDISERKAAEEEKKTLLEQLNQSQKMESVGRLAGGIAHDFNNLLTPIIGFAELAVKEVPEQADTRVKIDRIIQAAMRAKDLVRQLLSFSRHQVLHMQAIDLNGVVSSFYDILRRTVSERIEIRLHLAPGLGGVRADRTNMEQVLMNLLVNAQDAIEGTGTVTIETAEVMLDEEYTRFHAETAPGRYVLLAVTDTGGGIAKGDLSHIFEPFFTTKTSAKGSGLGLATVYGIVKQHGGSIWVYSEEGQGTVFKMYFPVAEAASASTERAAPQRVASGKAGGIVLLVEDDELVRTMVKEVLLGVGYKVLEAGHPRQALLLAEGRQIDLLLTDVIMPEMAGPELHKRLLAVHPGLKAIFMSGYTDSVVQLGNGIELANFVQKPFTVQDIVDRVAAAMAGETWQFSRKGDSPAPGRG